MLRSQQLQLETEISPALIVPLPDQGAQIEFPGVVLDNLRQMLTRMLQNGPIPQRLALTSTLRHEGVSYLTLALGALLAHDLNEKVCVVDLNWWWPSALFADSEETGLAKVLQETAELDDMLIPFGLRNLTVLPAGVTAKIDRPVIARGQALQANLAVLQERFDYLLLDVPAILATSDAAPLASLAEQVCLVIHQGVTPIEDVRKALEQIKHLSIAGVVLNRTRQNTPALITRLLAVA